MPLSVEPPASPLPLPELALAAEQAGLDASAPPEQLTDDGWLIRLSPGKAKRSRCINALAVGQSPLEHLLARCQARFEAAGLPLLVRITPFSQPADLDAQLLARGWTPLDAADVLVRPSLLGLAATPAFPGLSAVDTVHYADIVGQLRGSSPTEIAAHAQRMQASPVRYQGFFLHDPDSGELLALGQFALDAARSLVGIYDVFTPEQHRGRGHGRRLVLGLLAEACRQGALAAYLQVSVDNEAAQALYASLGFVQAYRYHFRMAPAQSAR